jgi:Ca-activated chloride channel family protein
MKLGNIHAIHYIWLLLALILFLFWSAKKRIQAMEGFADRELLNDLTYSVNEKGHRLKTILIAASLFFIMMALVRPQLGFEWQDVKRSGLDILIAIDTSKSMLAEDVKPNRLERSKLAVKDLIKKLRGDRIGLIAFAGSAFTQCPLTVDYNGFMLSLDALDVNIIPKGGTSITSAVQSALDSFRGGASKYKVLVIITDGEDHKGSTLEMAQKAKDAGIKVFTIGIGTKEGELIPIIDVSGNRSYLKDRSGNVVKTRLDESTLQEIALNTGGSYVKATNTELQNGKERDRKQSGKKIS